MRNQFKIFGLTVLAGGLLLLGLLPGAPGVASAGQPAQEVTESSASAEAFVPAGAFMMGCANDLFPDGCDRDTHPVHGVYLDAFYIDRTEVTNAQYRACVTAGACLPPFSNASQTRSTYYNSSTYNDYPVIQVDWNRANAYCHWVGKRLPTEAEWEKAARGTDLRRYPWGGQSPSCARVNFAGCVGDTAPVGSYPSNASPYGVLDMAGNVSEWVNDVYAKPYYQDSPYHNPQGFETSDPGAEHLVRGGAWGDSEGGMTSFVRLDGSEIYHYFTIGFRCARSAPGPSPTPTRTPTPTPTPTPFAARTIGPDGGALWLASTEHLTLLDVPPGHIGDDTTFTLTAANQPDAQGSLNGIGHFFFLQAAPLAPSASLTTPVQIIAGFESRGPLISNTVGLYRLNAGYWLTDGITVTEQTANTITAWVENTGTYGVLGRTNRTLLPLVLRVN